MVAGEHVVEQAIEQIAAGAGSVVVPQRSFGRSYWAKVRAFERSMYVGSLESPRFFSYDLFEALGGFDENLRAMEDTDLGHRASARAKVAGYRDIFFDDEGALTFSRPAGRKPGTRRGLPIPPQERKPCLGGRLRRPYFEHPSLLLAQPTLGPGVLALKGGEAAAVAGRLCST